MAPGLVGTVLAQLEQLIGLAPGDVARRRLQRHPDLLDRTGRAAPHIDDEDWAAVIDAVTVQETRLFRHPDQCAQLRAAALPCLVRAAASQDGQRLRILSAGCATGEEVWTLAALAGDAIAESGLRLGLEVTGLDLSRPALRQGAKGAFPPAPPDPLRDTPAALSAAFEVAGSSIAVAPRLRGTARFQRANLLDLPADGPEFDVIAFRNVGMYLTDAARAAVTCRLAAKLKPGGTMMLGSTDPVPRDAGLIPWPRDAMALYRRVPA